MSTQYDTYLRFHKNNVERAYEWLVENLPECTDESIADLIYNHDASKTDPMEYDPYDAYFYGGQKTPAVMEAFQCAWLCHIHRNPHHWQHWILVCDDPSEGEIVLEMPYRYVVEMLCDWWSFGWRTGKLRAIFRWYEERKDHLKLHNNTRAIVEEILDMIRDKLDMLETEELSC